MTITYAAIGYDPDSCDLIAFDSQHILPHHPMDPMDAALWAAITWTKDMPMSEDKCEALNTPHVFVRKRGVRWSKEGGGQASFSIITPDNGVMLVDRFDGNDPQDVSHILRTLPINGCLDTTVQGPLVSHAMRTRIARTIQRDRHNGHASEELRFESALVLGMLRAIVARNPTQAVFPHMKAMNLLLEIATTQRRRSLGIKRYGQGYTDYPEHDLFRAGLVTWTGVDEQRRFVLDTPAVDALLAGTPALWTTLANTLATHVSMIGKDTADRAHDAIVTSDPEINEAPLDGHATAHTTMNAHALVTAITQLVDHHLQVPCSA